MSPTAHVRRRNDSWLFAPVECPLADARGSETGAGVMRREAGWFAISWEGSVTYRLQFAAFFAHGGDTPLGWMRIVLALLYVSEHQERLLQQDGAVRAAH